jgi:hypothetical protein
MINSRSMLQALVYVIEGRADWLARKAASARNKPERKPGRAADVAMAQSQAAAIKKLIHGASYGTRPATNEHEYPSCPLEPALVGLALAYACGNNDITAELRAAMRAATAPDVVRIIDALIALRVLPPREKPTEPA